MANCDPIPQEAPLTFAAGNFVDGYCPLSYQQFANDIAAALSGTLPGTLVGWSVGSTKPVITGDDPGAHTRPWLKLDETCNFERIYFFNGGEWRSPHPDFIGKVILYEGLEVDVPTLDGGTAGAVTDSTGPFWEIITAMAAKIPMGPGTLPGFQTPPESTTIAVGVNGGSEGQVVTIGVGQLPAHSHDIAVESSTETADSELGRFKVSDGNLRWSTAEANDTTNKVGHTRLSELPASGTADPINVSHLPPVRGIWFLRKTSRIYFSIPAL